MESFIQSCEQFENYPQNLIRPDSLLHNLKAHSERLRSHEKRLFDEKQAALDFWDLTCGDQDFHAARATSLDELKEVLRKAVREGESDPQCRFIFLHSAYSRAALNISRTMLKFLFSYHQVIPSFLDFVYPFGKQIHAQDFYFSGLRDESRLDEKRRGPNIPEMGRSGKELRFCYNLRSVEPSRNQGDLPWSIRQSAMYHSFDLSTGNSVWVNVKGNQLIKDRITEASTESPWYKPRSRSEAFSASLGTHLLLCDWSCENWRWYINDLENRFHEYSADALAVPIEKPSTPIPSPVPISMSRVRTGSFGILSRSTTAHTPASPSSPSLKWDTFSPKTPSRSTTLVEPPEDDSPSPSCFSHTAWSKVVDASTLRRPITSIRVYLKRLGQRNASRQERVDQRPLSATDEKSVSPESSEAVLVPPELPPTFTEEGNERPDETFSFGNLQLLQQIEDKAHEALLVLRQNSGVLEDLRQHYEFVANHAEYPAELHADCELDLERFHKCVLSAQKDLLMLQSRIETLLRMISNRKNLLSNILEYRSIKANEFFTKRAHRITREMHTIAKKTEQETVSMRVITTVTLFFLPATFIATFMSTDILNFEDGRQDLQIRGLRIYLAIALPLTALTFLAWYMIYRGAKRGVPLLRRCSGNVRHLSAV